MPLRPGDVLLNGQYRIEGQLGRGAFGSVYKGHDTHLREDVAIKELLPALVGDEETLKRFLAEAKATMRLSHDRIVRTHHVLAEGEAGVDRRYYLVMEYMAGGSLEDWLAAHGPLPVDDTVRIAVQVTEGLAYAHDRGIVHCDLKPANILFTAVPPNADAGAKVADFGIAHVSDLMLTRTWQTAEGFVAGTLPYMSPEQTMGQRDDPRVDVYALGAVLYHMLTGRTYLDFSEEDTPYALADSVLRIHHEQPGPPSGHNPGIPTWLDDVVIRALQKRPEDRFPAATELQSALLDRESVSRTPGAGPRLPEPPEPPPALADIVPLSGEPRAPGPSPPEVERGEAIPSPMAEFRQQLARVIEEAQLAAVASKRETLAGLEQGRQGIREEQRRERLRNSEEALQRAAEKIQRLGVEFPLAPMLRQLGSMVDEIDTSLESLDPALDGIGPGPSQVGPGGGAGRPNWQRIGIELVPIPAGAFLSGHDKERIHLPEYHIARTPVTNAQYRAFVQAMGYPGPRHWKEGRIPQGKEDHPVVNVSWYDAVVFCGWAGCRLPTEQEWEKGARGSDGLEYPWGDQWEEGRSNTVEAGIGDTTPVERYLQGASSYGLLDVAGNVQEWCEDWYEEKQKHRVLKGGALDKPAAAARCAHRQKREPARTSGTIGFRVAKDPDEREA